VFLLHCASSSSAVNALDENDYSAAGNIACVGCGKVGISCLWFSVSSCNLQT